MKAAPAIPELSVFAPKLCLQGLESLVQSLFAILELLIRSLDGGNCYGWSNESRTDLIVQPERVAQNELQTVIARGRTAE